LPRTRYVIGIALGTALSYTLTTSFKAIITDRTIEISVVDADLPDLTLVDLPGLTQSAEDDQNKDMPAKIKALVTSWIEQPNTIILLVVPSGAKFDSSPNAHTNLHTPQMTIWRTTTPSGWRSSMTQRKREQLASSPSPIWCTLHTNPTIIRPASNRYPCPG
jgi:hypothetical protein